MKLLQLFGLLAIKNVHWGGKGPTVELFRPGCISKTLFPLTPKLIFLDKYF